ncbi:hypothetical protein LOK74_17480 [Brevibacillus humidisoli]|nr:hypothetical protein [Brevibacillus humidisoli]UFJ39824.1 hypothetical protein LOK74_17480 [Brevibacillus humidisoli]
MLPPVITAIGSSPILGAIDQPNLESVAALQPDLILGSKGGKPDAG